MKNAPTIGTAAGDALKLARKARRDHAIAFGAPKPAVFKDRKKDRKKFEARGRSYREDV